MADIDMPLAWRMQQDGYLMQINQLRDERDKLRTLVQDMCEWAYIDSCCDLQGEFAERIRELRIEVDK